MVITKEKTNQPSNLRENAIRQAKKISLSLFNYCFLVYYHLIKEIKRNLHYAHGVFLDVGCGSSPCEYLFRPKVEKYLKHDHPDCAKSDINYEYLSELPTIPAKDSSIDTVFCSSVLEHVSKPFETLHEINRILKPNGILLLSVPQYWHLHEEPHDYLRFTKYILKTKLEESRFEIISIEELGGAFATVGQAFCNALVLMFDLEPVKNIFNFLSTKKTKNLGESLIYALSRSPIILLTFLLIPIINLFFLCLDKLAGSPRDTIGYFVVAQKKN